MFDYVHKNKLIIQILLGIIIVPFAFFGLESYTRSVGNVDEIAKVEGQTISGREFSEELRQQLDRVRGLLGRGADVSAFDTPEARSAVLDSMIDRRLLAHIALKSNLTLSDAQLREVIMTAAGFQVDGRFSKDSYDAVLRAQNMTPAAFESRLRYDMAISQLTRALSDSAIGARSVAERLAAIEEQKREVAEAVIPAQPLLAAVKVDEAQIRTYYEANTAQFRTPELLRAEYIVLSADKLGAADSITEDEVKVAYESRAAQYRQQEQRRVSHILIPAGADATPSDKEAARKKAESLLAELKKSPGRFAELARRHSQDPGSAEKGGDLGMVDRGVMVKPFEDAAFALKQGETSAVQTEFGFHILRVTEIVGSKTKTLDEVRGELVREVARQKGARRFAESAEVFSSLVYEQADSLKPASDRFKLAVQRTDWIGRTASPAAGLFANPKLIAALFSTEVIEGKANTEAVEVAPGVLVSARVVEHKPAAQLKFEEVKADIENRLRREEAARQAHKDGAAKLAELKSGKDAGLKWSPVRVVSRRSGQGLSPDAQRQVMSADTTQLPAYIGVNLENGYTVYRVSKVIDAEQQSEQQKNAAAARYMSQVGSQQYQAYVASLRSRAEIAVNKANLEKKQP